MINIYEGNKWKGEVKVSTLRFIYGVASEMGDAGASGMRGIIDFLNLGYTVDPQLVAEIIMSIKFPEVDGIDKSISDFSNLLSKSKRPVTLAV